MSPQATRLKLALRAHGLRKISVRTQSRRVGRGREYGDATSGPFRPGSVDLHGLAAACDGTVFVMPGIGWAFLDSRWQPGGRVVEITWPDPKGLAVYREVEKATGEEEPFKQYICETHDRVYHCADCMDELLAGADEPTKQTQGD